MAKLIKVYYAYGPIEHNAFSKNILLQIVFKTDTPAVRDIIGACIHHALEGQYLYDRNEYDNLTHDKDIDNYECNKSGDEYYVWRN